MMSALAVSALPVSAGFASHRRHNSAAKPPADSMPNQRKVEPRAGLEPPASWLRIIHGETAAMSRSERNSHKALLLATESTLSG